MHDLRTMRFKARLQNDGIIVFSNIISALDKIGSKCMMHLTKEKVMHANSWSPPRRDGDDTHGMTEYTR